MGKASYWTQADALLRKNLTFQKRNKRSNISLIIFPVLLCVLLVLLQVIIDSQLDKPDYKCGCNSENQCGLEYSSPVQAPFCALTSPMKWPGLLQIPAPEYRAVRTDFMRSTDLPDESCRASGTCPVITLLTGNNQSLAQSLGDYMLKSSPLNASDSWASLASNVFGTASIPDNTIYFDRAFSPGNPVYWIQPQCPRDFSLPVEVNVSNNNFEIDVKCAQALNLWRSSSSQINDELYKGYRRGNPEKKINEIVGAYDFINSTGANFNVNIWYNATYKNDTGYHQFNRIGMARVPRSVNLVSNAYLQFLQGPSTKILLEFIKEMPKPGTELHVDISSLVGPMFFAFVIIALFPTVLTFLVYENQNRLRIMMKMHGLGDGPYWLISYAYFLALSSLYMICFVVFASLIGLKFFKLNDYSIQFVFYFLYINLQISLAFLVAPFFSNVLTARVIGYILIFGTGLLGGFLLEPILVDTEFPKGWILVMELYPGFSLYRGLYEFGQYAFMGNLVGSSGMEWKNLSDDQNGMKEVLIIMLIEWLILLPLAFYVDSVVSSGSGVKRSPLYFLSRFWKSSPTLRKPSLRKNGSKVFVELEKPDVLHERERVGQMLNEGNTNDSVICDNLAKVYPGRDGNPPKNAVKGISLALPRGECFGMLGPNGAGKTSFIGMMIGLLKPTSGRAYVEGHDILTQMDEIYTSMGVCPQHDLLWESLTGREHLMFYGRLKNLKGNALLQAVEESLKSVNLFYGGVGNKLSKKYSGGMKRRLSVAISLIGDPKVVYMDEPSTGLDPASRNNLWNVVRRAKRDRAIVLTTHSMEEAEHLCDRLGIFVDGSLQCIGNPKELKARYGGSFVFTMTTESSHENEVRNMVQSLSPNAQRIYHISGTQKFELPKQEVRISDVFQAVQNAKSRFAVYAWGIADTTLEDVFIKVAREAQAFNVFS